MQCCISNNYAHSTYSARQPVTENNITRDSSLHIFLKLVAIKTMLSKNITTDQFYMPNFQTFTKEENTKHLKNT